jgi:hypothetical protein
MDEPDYLDDGREFQGFVCTWRKYPGTGFISVKGMNPDQYPFFKASHLVTGFPENQLERRPHVSDTLKGRASLRQKRHGCPPSYVCRVNR